jgi:hypothetical protein
VIAKFVRAVGLVGLVLIGSAPGASAANQKEIDEAIKRGAEALKAKYGRGAAAVPLMVPDAAHGIGPTALAGLALLEAKVPGTDPALKLITEQVRDAAYRQNKTYQIALCLMFLDRFGEPADVPLIQALALRLLAGQTKDGGWNYDSVTAIPPADEQRLRAGLKDTQLVAGSASGGGKGPPKLHPEVEKYGQTLQSPANGSGGDNSNTQFATLAVWMARKHGVPADNALDALERRFMASQDPRTGNWSYSLPPANSINVVMPPGSPSMYCSGLLAMSTGLARREERQLANKPPPKHDTAPKTETKPDDPFYNPPAGEKPPPKPAAGRPADARDLVVQRAFAGLGLTLADQIRGKGLIVPTNAILGTGDLYFLWSLERVGVIYGVDKIGGFDWYDLGSTALVRSQNADGTWNFGKTFGAEVNTAFAVLFLCKANLARDLSSKVQKDPTSTEMRAGAGPSATDLLPNRPPTSATPTGTDTAAPAPITLPNPSGDAAVALASEMLRASGADWVRRLNEARDGKGTHFTRALVVAAENAEGDRKKQARDALAERLCRMTPATLRTMLGADEAELRRAAALACAMKDDKDHVPDLIAALEDKDESVVRAARAGLKSLTGKDLGPAPGASAAQKAAAVRAWREWYNKEKK